MAQALKQLIIRKIKIKFVLIIKNHLSLNPNKNVIKMPTRLVIGCNYHTTWQSHKAMRFVLVELNGDKARLQTRNTRKDFWTNIKDLIFIDSVHNTKKANTLTKISEPIPNWVNTI